MCEWKSKYDTSYRCQDTPLDGDPKGYCILHSPNKGKPPEEFTKKVEERMNQGRYYYRVAEDPPPGVSEHLTDKISYDSSRKLLVYSGGMSEGERDDLLKLSGDSEYGRAISKLFEKSRNEPIDLVGCHFPESFNANYFIGYTFERPVNFTGATFSQKAFFPDAKFSEGANFGSATFSKEANFGGATFLQIAEFADAVFKGDTEFSRVKFFKDAIFEGAVFEKRAYFGGRTEFCKWARFLEVAFLKEAEFLGVLFDEYVDFREATFEGIANFHAVFKKGVTFVDARFKKTDFSGSDFLGNVEFSECKFEGDTDFTGVIFKETCEKAEFKDVVFRNEANFSASYYQKTTIDFTGTTFKGRTSFTPYLHSGMSQEINLGEIKFNTVNFLGQVIFQNVDLSHCSFLHSNIDKVDFRYCEFAKKDERLLWVFPHQRQNVLMDELKADELLEGSQDSMGHSERSEESRPFAYAQGDRNKKLRGGKYEPVRRLYLELKRNFEDKKDWNTAGDFHYGEMECRRKMKGWLGRNLLSLEAVYYWASGYGERPWRALLWWFFSTLLFFPFLYRLSEHDPLSACVWDSVRVATFMKIGIPIEPESWGRIVLTLQYFICPTLLALFALALRRKVKR